jgi:hypothetical protein
LPEIEITKDINLHIISPEPIQYVDLSTQTLTGDLPTTNIARIKITDNMPVDTKEKTKSKFIFQWKHCRNHYGSWTILYHPIQSRLQNSENRNIATNIHIQPEAMQPIEFNKMTFSSLNWQSLQCKLFRKNR